MNNSCFHLSHPQKKKEKKRWCQHLKVQVWSLSGVHNEDNGNCIKFHHEAFGIHVKEAMFSLASICWFVRGITQKILSGFP